MSLFVFFQSLLELTWFLTYVMLPSCHETMLSWLPDEKHDDSLISEQFKWFHFSVTEWNFWHFGIICLQLLPVVAIVLAGLALLTRTICQSMAHGAATSCGSTPASLCLTWRLIPGSMETLTENYISLVKLSCRVFAWWSASSSSLTYFLTLVLIQVYLVLLVQKIE